MEQKKKFKPTYQKNKSNSVKYNKHSKQNNYKKPYIKKKNAKKFNLIDKKKRAKPIYKKLVFRKSIFQNFVGNVLKKGNKNIAKSIMFKSLIKASYVTKLKPIEIMNKITRLLGSTIELRTIKIRRNTFSIPCPVKKSRRNYLIVKKIISSSKRDSTKRPFDEKIFEELVSTIKRKNSKSILVRNETIKNIVANKSNLHYRW